jgi:hypothetical protein
VRSASPRLQLLGEAPVLNVSTGRRADSSRDDAQRDHDSDFPCPPAARAPSARRSAPSWPSLPVTVADLFSRCREPRFRLFSDVPQALGVCGFRVQQVFVLDRPRDV